MELLGFYQGPLLNTFNFPSVRFHPLRINIHSLTVSSPQSQSTASPDRNQSRLIPVPSGTVWNSLGIVFEPLEYLPPQNKSSGNWNPCLGSLFSPNVKSLGVQIAIGVNLSKFNLELFWIPGELLWQFVPPNIKSLQGQMGINVYLLQFHLQLFGFHWELLLNTCYTPLSALILWEFIFMAWQSVLPHCKSTESPDGNQSRSVAFPSGTV